MNALNLHITGMGLVTPAGLGIGPLWNACLEKKSLTVSGLGRVSEKSEQTAIEFFSHSPWIKNKPAHYSRALTFVLYALIEAVENANWNQFNDDDLIIIGTTTGQITEWEEALINLIKEAEPTDELIKKISKQPLSSLADDLKTILEFPGRIIITSSACSASTQAMILAGQFLKSKRAARCIAGGLDELGLLTINGFSCLKLLVETPCKPFDKNRNGINLSEGAAFYTLESGTPVASLALFLHGQTHLDSYHMTSPEPEGAGLQMAIIESLKNANLTSKDISVVHAHGTASTHNDQAESKALTHLFPTRPPVISTKGVHGHALGASAAIELGISLMMLKNQIVPAVTGLEEIMEDDYSLNHPKEIIKHEINFILKTTLGFGGVNSIFILGKSPNA